MAQSTCAVCYWISLFVCPRLKIKKNLSSRPYSLRRKSKTFGRSRSLRLCQSLYLLFEAGICVSQISHTELSFINAQRAFPYAEMKENAKTCTI